MSEPAPQIAHLDGMSWWKAPIPRLWHRCWPQTVGHIRGQRVERCACGAGRLGSKGPWEDRNARRRRS